MAKRNRPRKSLGGNPPPPDRQSFERHGNDVPPQLKTVLIENLRAKTFDQASPEAASSSDNNSTPRPQTVPDILVPMTCTKKSKRYFIRFKWRGDYWDSPENIITEDDKGRGNAGTTSFQLAQIKFEQARCVCGEACSPILCGSCQQYCCDAGVKKISLGQRMHFCLCGTSGILQPTLKEVSGSKSSTAQAPGARPGDMFRLTYRGS
jgi:hypothetical protein